MRSALPYLRWSARILGLLLTVFVGVFALDAFEPGAPPSEQALHFLLHSVPAIALLAIVLLAWRWPLIGGVILLALASGYGIRAIDHPGWILAISGPLAIVGSLFISTWFFQRNATRTK
ncbi:MAG: hypothetical protein IPG74_10945 [Flavobacteriales bacterium]|nr:hypothetical protein [Flavobacteriales bacterium]MBK7556392.1 hypothetical protein [Flavobacteriales bacterium]MBK9193667.1 hypothetical protein [Flavobacteriales bacterium]MBP6573819.1 hypothetical protein [Flavobacteriales bacterium]